MKRFFLIALTASSLLVPAVAYPQGVILVYRPELRGMIAVPAPRLPAVAKAVVEKVPPTPAEVIARHEAMAAGLRANANLRGGAAIAADHCDRLVAAALATLRKSF